MIKILVNNVKHLNSLNMVKTLYRKSIADIILNGQTRNVNLTVKKYDIDAYSHCYLFHGVIEVLGNKISFFKKVPERKSQNYHCFQISEFLPRIS